MNYNFKKFENDWNYSVSQKSNNDRFKNGFYTVVIEPSSLMQKTSIDIIYKALGQIIYKPFSECPWGFYKNFNALLVPNLNYLSFCLFDHVPFNYSAWAIYWVITEELNFYIRAGHVEDIPARIIPKVDPGAVYFCQSPVSIIGNSIAFVSKLFQIINHDNIELNFETNWFSPNPRSLVPFDNLINDVLDAKYFYDLNAKNYKNTTNNIEIKFKANSSKMKVIIPELLFQPMQEFFSAFKYVTDPRNLKNYLTESTQFHVDNLGL